MPAPARLRAGCASAAQPALRLPVAQATTTGRSLPLHPRCCATGVPGQAAPYAHFNSMRARWGNVSHSARGGVDNHHHDDDRAQAHDRRRPRHPPVLRNGGWRGLRLTIRDSTSTPLARPRYALTIPTSPGVRPRSRFAPSNTPRQVERPRRSQRARPPSTPACHAGCFRSFHIERPTASRPRTRATKPTPAGPRTPPEPLRSGAFTMQ